MIAGPDLDPCGTNEESVTEAGDAVNSTQSQRRRPGPEARFTSKIVVHEEPQVVRELGEAAERSGGSVAAEIRRAIRYWLSANE